MTSFSIGEIIENFGDKMFVTTAGRTNEVMITQAMEIAKELKIEYVVRKKKSIHALQSFLNDDCIVVGKDRLELFPFGEKQPFFFHPNSSMFRIKRIIGGDLDPFIVACQLEKGTQLLDCTLGLASDSIVASHIVGDPGRVVGLEGNPYLAYIVKKGLASWDSRVSELNECFGRLEVVNCLALEYLKNLKDDSFDVVYFDPMFEEHINESNGINGLSKVALYEDISDEMISHAKRVARKRVVLKDHFRSKRFNKYQFEVIQRKSAKFHFGVIEIQ